MTGKILEDLKRAEICIPGGQFDQSFNAIVKIAESEKITDDMAGMTYNFELKIPCTQFCGRSTICSARNKKVCEEATVTILQ